METAVLQYIIETYFTRKQIQQLFPGDNSVKDAVEAILCEDSGGMDICRQLDKAAELQREKIRSMSPRELRASLSVEFLEPGKRLTLILWALLRDDRLSARTLASQITDHFTNLLTPAEEAEQESTTPFHRIMQDEPLDVIPMEPSEEPSIEISEEDLEMDRILADLNSDDITGITLPDKDDLFSSITPQQMEDELPEENSFMEESDSDDITFEENTSSEEVTSFLDSLKSEERISAQLNLDDLEEVLDQHLPKSFTLSDINEEPEFTFGTTENEPEFEIGALEDEPEFEIGELEEEPEFEIGALEDEGKFEIDDEEEPEFLFKPTAENEIETEPETEMAPFHFETIDENTLNKELGDMAEIESMMQDAESEELIPIEDLIHEEMKHTFPDEPSLRRPPIEKLTPSKQSESIKEMVSLGGVEISLGSLKTACEKIFLEPVELVVDKNLTENDQIVVVGKRCGVRVLHGPRYEIYSEEKLQPIPDTPITVSPISMQAALSKVYGETVELVPDPKLLKTGIIIFAGRETGLSLVHNQSLKVPVPPWAESIIPGEKEDDSAVIKEELSTLRDRFTSLESEINSLQSSINQRFEAITMAAPATPAAPTAPPAAPPVAPITPIAEPVAPPVAPVMVAPAVSPPLSPPPLIPPLPPTPEPVAIQTPVPEPSTGTIAETAISSEDIETEELEPIHETSEDLLASLATLDFDTSIPSIKVSEDENTVEEQDGTGISLDTLDSLTDGLPSEDLLGGDMLSDDLLSEDLLGEEISLDEFNLDDLTTETDDLTAETKEISESENDDLSALLAETSEDELDLGTIGTGTIDLDSLDLDGLDDLAGLDSNFTVTEETEEDEGAIKPSFDLDLDVLAELDMEEENSFSPKEVLNGERILLLGGDTKNKKEYNRIIKEIGGQPEWHGIC